MMNQQTLDKLHALRWFGLAEAWRQQMEMPEVASLSFDERFSLLVDQHWTWRENQAMARRLKKSKLDAEPCVEDIDLRHPRGLDRSLIRTLSKSQWVAQHHSLLFTGPTRVTSSMRSRTMRLRSRWGVFGSRQSRGKSLANERICWRWLGSEIWPSCSRW